MTRAEILNCLTDRPCDACRFHESGRCERWDCVFEEKPDDAENCEDKRMTREEAIKALKYERKTALHENKSAFDMAIKALSAEPCEELEFIQPHKKLSVNLEVCTDAISRQAVLDGIDNYIEKAQSTGAKDDFISFEELVVKALPPVTPKQKMGHWIKVVTETDSFGNETYRYECSECGFFAFFGTERYCPYCGAKMEVSENG